LNYYRNNTVNSHGLVTTAIAAGIRHFIFSSTAVVCGNPTAIPIGETHPTAPINPYGRSKLMTEMMLADTAEAHVFNFCALRYFNVAGADPDLRTGQSTAGATHLIEVAVEAALGKRDENASILRELKWQPRHDDLETIIRHALAWERKLSEMQTGR
jgi:UDP-glucose 4-epimerase